LTQGQATHPPLLLDTQILIWLAVDPQRIPVPWRERISDRDTQLAFSVASIWEVAIKTSLGKAGFRLDAEALRRGLLAEGLSEIPIAAAEAAAVQHLPWLHRDPFDRLLVAQAQQRNLILLTADQTLNDYGPWVRCLHQRQGA
jgi:PIN domain nuclease of toxin-antitoxin system